METIRMTLSRHGAVLLTILFLGVNANATLVGSKTQVCPVCGKTNTFEQWVSFGSYVYDRPSKYDLVFFPATSEGWLWMCPACGYAQTGSDFSDLKPKDAKRLKAILEKEWQSDTSTNIPFSIRLERTIRTNELLGRDKEFWKLFNRVLIYHYRTLDPEKALRYAESEIRLLEEEMSPTKDTLYLLGEYHRMLGHTSVSRDYFRRALETFVNRPIEICLIVFSSTLAGLTGFIWGRLKRKLIVKVCVTLATGVLLMASFRFYEKLKRFATPDEYYDQLIRDRISLLSHKSNSTAEQKKMSTEPNASGGK
jgi:hypothetical protein